MHQADAHIRQNGRQQRGGLFRGLALQRLGFLDQGAHPVGLPPGGAGAAHPLHDFVAAFLADGHCLHRQAPGRQFIDHRGVQVGVNRHGQGAWNRRGRHYQLMRALFSGAPLVAQRQALVHAEAVLLVDDDQPQPGELDLLLEQGVGADGHRRFARPDRLQGLGTLAAAAFPCMPYDIDSQGRQPLPETAVMLLCQQLGRRHQGRLVTGLHRDECGAGGHHRLAGAHIPLYQTRHRVRPGQIGPDLQIHPLLGAGERERERTQEGADQAIPARKHRGCRLLAAQPQPAQTQVMRQQLLEGESLLGGVAAFCQQLQRGIRGRAVHVAQRLLQRGHPAGREADFPAASP